MRWLPLFLLACGVVEDATPLPPPAPLALTATPMKPGRAATIEVTGAQPGDTVYIGVGQPGAGPCPPQLGGTCLGLVAPTLLGAPMADASGAARLDLLVPSLPHGLTASLQAATLSGAGGLSPTVSVTIQLDIDDDGDGYLDGIDCDDGNASIHPMSTERPEDGVDNDCNGADRQGWSRIVLGDNRACGLSREGRLLCWGLRSSEHDYLPDGDYLDADGGRYQLCAITDDGRLACAGDELDEPITVPDPLVSIGYDDFLGCVLDVNGQAHCWDRTTINPAVAPTDTFDAIDVGREHACGLRPDGTVGCWGFAGTVPTAVFEQIAAGRDHTCARDAAGVLTCWGEDDAGETQPPAGLVAATVAAHDETTCVLEPSGALTCFGGRLAGLAPTGSFDGLEAGGNGFCAYDRWGLPTCWGADNWTSDTPPGLALTAVHATGSGFCGLDENGWPVCIGDGPSGAPSRPFRDMDLEATHACGLAVDGTVTCWGDDSRGQLALTGARALDVDVGPFTTCIVRTSGQLACAGDDSNGQTSPPGGTYVSVSVHERHACALRASGGVACWGRDRFGESTPPSGRFTAVAASGVNSCGIRLDGDLECWGLGAGVIPAPAVPFVEVEAGNFGTCTLDAAGTPSCLGITPTRVPTQALTDLDVSGYSACAHQADGQPVCWGTLWREPIPDVP